MSDVGFGIACFVGCGLRRMWGLGLRALALRFDFRGARALQLLALGHGFRFLGRVQGRVGAFRVCGSPH